MFQHFKKQFVKDYLLALKDKHSIRVKTTVVPLAKSYSNNLLKNILLVLQEIHSYSRHKKPSSTCQVIFKHFTKQFIKEYFTSIAGDTFLLEAQKA